MRNLSSLLKKESVNKLEDILKDVYTNEEQKSNRLKNLTGKSSNLTPTDLKIQVNAEFTDELTVSRSKTDIKAISYDGMIYNHENIVSVINQTVDIIHDIPMRIIGMSISV